MPTPTGESEAPAALGTAGAAVALVGSGLAVRTGGVEPASGALLAATAVAIAVMVGRRHDLIGRRLGAVVGAMAGLAHLPLAVLVISRGLSPTVALPVFGSIPIVLVAALGGLVVVAGAAADAVGLDGRGIVERTVATSGYGAVGVGGYVAIIVWLIPLAALYTAVTGSGIDVSSMQAVALERAATVFGVGSTVAVFLAVTGRDWTFIDLKVPSIRDVVVIVLGVVAILAAAAGISALLAALETESATHGSVETASSNPEILLVLIPASILIIGPFEELLFRNVVQKPLYEYFSKPGAVVAASLPFALIHFAAYGSGTVGEILTSLSIVLSLSLLLGGLYAYTENLVVPALVHGIYNAVLFLNLYLALTA